MGNRCRLRLSTYPFHLLFNAGVVNPYPVICVLNAYDLRLTACDFNLILSRFGAALGTYINCTVFSIRAIFCVNCHDFCNLF
jgi:hypothetical protein